MVGRARTSAVRRFELRIGADLTKTDERIATFVGESQGNFVRDEYGRRREDFSQRAKEIVADGVARGLGRDDIAGDLSAALTSDAFDRNQSYWDMVSMVFVNRARSYTQLAALEEAAVQTYVFEAVMDEVTSEICRLLHGRVFPVSPAMDRFREVERLRDPERIREVTPFVQVGADEEGNQVLFYERNGRRRAVAQVDEPAVGTPDAVGRYSRVLSNQELQAAGVTVPPLHGHCRSTIVMED